jgi:hypothetical protein
MSRRYFADVQLTFIERQGVNTVSYQPTYAVLVGGANGDVDLRELIDGHSHELQFRSAFEIGRLILYGRASIDSTIVTRSHHTLAHPHLTRPPQLCPPEIPIRHLKWTDQSVCQNLSFN